MEPNRMGAAGQPMPNQQIPTQPRPMQADFARSAATQAAGQAPEQMVSVEEQMMAAIDEPISVDPSMMNSAPAMESPKKTKANGMLIGMVIAIVVAVAGIVFGVIMMINANGQAADYEKQIKNLKSTNATLQDQVDATETLNGDEALTLLQEAVATQGLPYNIAYANVYARYNGEDDTVAYWVKYMPINVPEGVVAANDIIFTMNEEGEWTFALPGFTGYTQELINNYVSLDGEALNITATVVESETPVETPTVEATDVVEESAAVDEFVEE